MEICSLSLTWCCPFGDFLEELENDDEDNFFQPHPLTREEAKRRCEYTGKDIYCILVNERDVLGYGMLRGWDEGFDVPSLGLALSRSARGFGFGALMINFLHASAKFRGAEKIMLKVHQRNTAALALYRKFGYEFSSHHELLRGVVRL